MSLTREQLDDFATASRDVARTARAQYMAFREMDFGKSDSLSLTMHMMSLMFGHAEQQIEGEE
jgi:hypothetical protein